MGKKNDNYYKGIKGAKPNFQPLTRQPAPSKGGHTQPKNTK